MEKILAIIVTYNPGEEVKENILRISKQVGKTIVIDNGSNKNFGNFLFILNKLPNIIVEFNSKNEGIGAALNIGVQFAIKNNFKWVATFDQDSTIQNNYFKDLIDIYNQIPNKEMIGLISPRYFNPDIQSFLSPQKKPIVPFQKISTTMASGNLIKTEVFGNVGYFNSTYFMDYVDHEFCLRLLKNNFIIIEIPSVFLRHRLGAMKKHKLFGFIFNSTNHSAWRRFYITRNRILTYRKFFFLFPVWVFKDMRGFLKETIKIILIEKQKLKKCSAILKGIFFGILNRAGKI